MAEHPSRPDKQFPSEVQDRERRKLRARQHPPEVSWFGLGMFGMVGWSVAIPTVVGIFVGLWIDLKWPGPHSWTLMLLVIGLILGCLNAWFWVNRERRNIAQEREEHGD